MSGRWSVQLSAAPGTDPSAVVTTEARSVDRIFALISAGVGREAFVTALQADDAASLPAPVVEVEGPAELLGLFLAGLQAVGPRAFLDRTADLLPKGATVAALAPRQSIDLKRRRVAVFSGAFDPITNSHLTCCAEVVHSRCADEVWIAPCRPWRGGPEPTTPALDRYCMCQLAVNTVFTAPFPVKVIATGCFPEGADSLSTYDLLKTLRMQHLELDFKFIVGSDWLQPDSCIADWVSPNHDWKEGDPEDQREVNTGRKILEEFEVVVIRRPGYEVPTSADDPSGLRRFGDRLSWLVMPEGTTFVQDNLSSSEIRKRTAHGTRVRETLASDRELDTIDGLVPRAVLGHIWRRRLYLPPLPLLAKRRKVAIYGGAFDPITNSHLTCAAEVVHSQCADEVWLVPCGPRPDKPALKTSPLDRLCMCSVAVNTAFTTHLPIRVSSIECFAEEAYATYDLLCSLRRENPDVDFSFIIGSDWLQPGSNMAEWTSRNWDWKAGDPEDKKYTVTGHKMLEEFDFLVIQRPGYLVTRSSEDPTGLKQFGPRLSWLVMPEGEAFVEGNLSSTEIRRRTAHAARIRDAAAHGQGDFMDIDGLVPPGVLAYIRRQALYAPPAAPTK